MSEKLLLTKGFTALLRMLQLLKAVPLYSIQYKQMLPDVHTRGLPSLAAFSCLAALCRVTLLTLEHWIMQQEESDYGHYYTFGTIEIHCC